MSGRKARGDRRPRFSSSAGRRIVLPIITR